MRQIPHIPVEIPKQPNYKVTNEGVLFLDVCLMNTECKVNVNPFNYLENDFIIKVDIISWNAYDYRYDSIIMKKEDSKKEMVNISVKLNGSKFKILNQEEPNEDNIQIIIKVYSVKFILLLKCIKEIVLFFEQNLACLKENLLEVRHKDIKLIYNFSRQIETMS